MYQVVQQTEEEKLEMYMKLNKAELAKMLIQANKSIDFLIQPKPVEQWIQPYVPYNPLYPGYHGPLITYVGDIS